MTNSKLNQELEKSKAQTQQDQAAEELKSDDLDDVSGGLMADDGCGAMGNCGNK